MTIMHVINNKVAQNGGGYEETRQHLNIIHFHEQIYIIQGSHHFILTHIGGFTM